MKLNANQLSATLGDARYADIGALPSQFHGYDWNKLYIRPFEIAEFKLISKAAALKDMSHMIRAIDLVITQDAWNLTIGDFYYLMMWLRIHSLPKTPLVITWECGQNMMRHKTTGEIIFNTNPYVPPKDPTEYAVVPCGTMNTQSVHMTTVDIISLDEDSEKVKIPEGFDFPRAKHIEGIAAALADPETTMLVAAAQWVVGDTVVDKFARLFSPEGPGMDGIDVGSVLNEKYTHGVKEVAVLNCRTCRHEEPYHVNITPLTFFP